MVQPAFILPEEVYRWLVAQSLLNNYGEGVGQGQVRLPIECNMIFENGFLVANIIRSILSKSSQTYAACLRNVKNEASKNIKQANWGFIWLSFSNLRLQFDTKIKDLIFQGYTTLIIYIVKQLYDKDYHRPYKIMQTLQIPNNKVGKSSSLNVKKLNSEKDPKDSYSTLEFLLLLLTASFGMPSEEILSLFTNQNKYLAHIIVKGINEDFTGVLLFYTLLDKHIAKLEEFCLADRKDAESCLYAIKPGLISKHYDVAKLTIRIFAKLSPFYDWFVSNSGKGSSTLLLGVKRHPSLVDSYWNLLFHLIQHQYLQYFTYHFKRSFKDSEEMIEICKILLQSISKSKWRELLINQGIIRYWLDIAGRLFDGQLQKKIIVFYFIGGILRLLPDAIEGTEESLSIFRRDWRERPFIDFIMLFYTLVQILTELAAYKNNMAKQLYQILLDILPLVNDIEQKRYYIIVNLQQLLIYFPSIPSHLIIEQYKQKTYQCYDYNIINTSIILCNDRYGLLRIGKVLLKVFITDAVTNYFIGPFLYCVSTKCFYNYEGQNMVIKIIKDCLYSVAHLEVNKKVPQLVKQPMYMSQKSHNKSFAKEYEVSYEVVDQQVRNLLGLVEQLAKLCLTKNLETVIIYIKEYLLDTNAFIRKNNFKVGCKTLTNILGKLYGVTKDEYIQHDEDYKAKKSVATMYYSLIKRKVTNVSNYLSTSKPYILKQYFNDIVEKRKKYYYYRKLEEQKKRRDYYQKKLQVKKYLEKANLLRGFGHYAELKYDGFWDKFKKYYKHYLYLYPPTAMYARDVYYIDNLFRKYHRALRSIFLCFTSSMHSGKSNANFDASRYRNYTLHLAELVRFLKEYKMYFLTNHNEVQTLLREMNVKMLGRRDSMELDFHGFEQFLLQFAALIFLKSHTLHLVTPNGEQTMSENLSHLSHLQLVEYLFNYLKLTHAYKGENVAIFDYPYAMYFSESYVIRYFNRKVYLDPNFILPEGYVKVTYKIMKLVPKWSTKNIGTNETYLTVFNILDDIVFKCLQFHLLEPLCERYTKTRVKPQAFVNVKPKLLELSNAKNRAYSEIIAKKPFVPPMKLLERKVLSFGMKLGLSYVSYKDKLLAEQVAYVVDDMLSAIENNRMSIDKEKIKNEVIKKKEEKAEKYRNIEIDREKRRQYRKAELYKLNKSLAEKKEKAVYYSQAEKYKKLKEQYRYKEANYNKEKYIENQRSKIKYRKLQNQEEQMKKIYEYNRKKYYENKAKKKFKEFNSKQIALLRQGMQSEQDKKKKLDEQYETYKKSKYEFAKKLRSKIHSNDRKAIYMRLKVTEQISELYNSESIQGLFNKYYLVIRALFDFLLKNTFYSLTEKKHNGEVVLESWLEFGLVFELSPLIIASKELLRIFKIITKDKPMSKEYYVGLTFDEFQQGLLRIAIRHKSIFNKLAEKIAETASGRDMDQAMDKDADIKEKNEFYEPENIDVRGLMEERDIDKSFADHYGDISKVNAMTLEGLFHYLKIPFDKLGQDRRFREIITFKAKSKVPKEELLKEKLNDGHLLASQAKQKPPKSSDRIKRSLEKITETLENTKQKKSITIAQADQLLKEGEEAMYNFSKNVYTYHKYDTINDNVE